MNIMTTAEFDRTTFATAFQLKVAWPLPPELGTCLLIHGFLSPQECASLIGRAECRGFVSANADYPPSYRNNDRQVVDEPAFAKMLLVRMQGLAPETIQDSDPSGTATTWRLKSLNERIRWCRYAPGQRFNIHQDGVHHRGPNCRSRLTFMVYLSGAEAFEGGDTLFYASGPCATGEFGAPPVVARVQPRAGSLIIFDHGIWHAGDTVTRGSKHILRSDLIYQREGAANATVQTGPFTPGHDGYVWTMEKLSTGGIASAGRDAIIRLWSPSGAVAGTLADHLQSVLGLSEIRPGVLASVSRDRSIRLWDLKTLSCTGEIRGHESAVLSIAKLSDGIFATGSADSTIVIRDGNGNAFRSLLGHTGWVWALCRVDANTLASASEDGTVRLWDVDRGACATTVSGLPPLWTIDMQSGDQSLLAAGDVTGWVRLWAIKGRHLAEISSIKAHDAAVRRVRFLSQGRLATCGEDQLLRIWQLADMTLEREGCRPNFVTDVVELPGEQALCSGYEGGLSVV